MSETIEVDLLNDAFNTFRDASLRLEQQYALLEQRVEELSAELAEKNRAMERTRRLAAMGEMAARIAHEIRNPLGSMAIFASILERELSEDRDKRDLARHITKGVKTLDNLLSNMLLFASSPSARLKLIDIKDVIEDSLLLTRGHEKKGVRIKKNFSRTTALLGDEGQLRQLFLNLFLNALDAVDEDGELSIEVGVSGEVEGPAHLRIEVRDTGKGIPKEHIDRIFDPFFSTKERGTGLGLAIVSAVVEAHKGLINVRSGEGAGTEFTIRLPLAAGRVDRKAA